MQSQALDGRAVRRLCARDEAEVHARRECRGHVGRVRAGGGQRYRTVEVGRVGMSVGSHRAVLRALSKPGEAVVNIRAVRLVPLE